MVPRHVPAAHAPSWPSLVFPSASWSGIAGLVAINPHEGVALGTSFGFSDHVRGFASVKCTGEAALLELLAAAAGARLVPTGTWGGGDVVVEHRLGATSPEFRSGQRVPHVHDHWEESLHS